MIALGLLCLAAGVVLGRHSAQGQLRDKDTELDYLRSLRDAAQGRWRL